MSKVYLEYNPFSGITICRVDGKDASDEFKKKCWGDSNKSFFQDWVEDFFVILHETENDDSYEVEFLGLPSDYKDLENAKDKFTSDNKIKIELIQKDINVKSSEERIKDLKDLLKYAQDKSPYPELKADSFTKEFNDALGEDEEIGIVATMSSGKSTLLNAILHQELLPAKNEATTAIIAKIHNDKSKKEFRVSAKDNNGHCICDDVVAESKLLEELNSNKDIADLRLFGNIPNIKEYGLKVVLSDTPGPNNSANEDHKINTRKLLDKRYKPMILYIFNATQLEINDDKTLLEDIAKKMRESGVQSKDRFIFVLNKVDMLDVGKGENAKKAIDRLRDYLGKIGIESPRIFAVSTYLSKVIRLKQSGLELTEDEYDFLYTRVKRFIDHEDRHLSDLAPLSKEGKKKQEALILKAKENKDDNMALADIYSGVPALEIAINEYVEKYAIRSKIKVTAQNIQAFIKGKEVQAKSLEALKSNKESIAQTLSSIEAIRNDIQNGVKSKTISDKIEKFDFSKNINTYLNEKRAELSNALSNLYNNDTQMDKSEAKRYIVAVNSKLEHFRQSFLAEVDERVNNSFIEDVKRHLNEYKNYINSLVSNNSSLDDTLDGKISLNVLVGADLNTDKILYEFKNTVEEEVFSHSTGNIDKAWYKPWTWFDDDYQGHYVTVNKDVFNASKFGEEYLADIYKEFNNGIEALEKETDVKVKATKKFFKQKAKDIEEIMLKKMQENENLLKDKNKFEEKIKEENKRLQWLDEFTTRLNKVLKIQGD